MAQLNSSKVVEPYGEVNVFNEADGRIRVKATILMKPEVEGAQTGLAIDGSKSMSELFGGAVAMSDIFGGKPNLVEPMAQTLAEYLAKFDQVNLFLLRPSYTIIFIVPIQVGRYGTIRLW